MGKSISRSYGAYDKLSSEDILRTIVETVGNIKENLEGKILKTGTSFSEGMNEIARIFKPLEKKINSFRTPDHKFDFSKDFENIKNVFMYGFQEMYEGIKNLSQVIKNSSFYKGVCDFLEAGINLIKKIGTSAIHVIKEMLKNFNAKADVVMQTIKDPSYKPISNSKAF